jgi:DNA-binding transcriptional regulator LsrR (DeoR family)
MTKETVDFEKISKQLDDVIVLLKQSIAISLYKSGATQDEIAKNLNLSKTTVNQMVKGIIKADQKTAKVSPK